MKPYYEKAGITIYHADCREVLPELADASVDMVFTDPPYGHNNNDGRDLIGRIGLFRGREYEEGAISEGRPIANDGAEATAELVQWLFAESKRLLKYEGCCCCCCCGGGGGPDPQFARWSLWMDEHLTFKQMVVWDKGPMGMGWHYRRSYETVLVAHKGQKCRWYDDTDRVENIIRPRTNGIAKIIPQEDDHPTPKPWQLPALFMRLHSAPGDLILDPFVGGGSTLEACAMLGRRGIGIEVEEAFCEASARRLQDMTPSLFAEVAP